MRDSMVYYSSSLEKSLSLGSEPIRESFIFNNLLYKQII